jgi:UDP-3-O-[3-hydroxymyristoyl] glucosamine N-acyltransferase
LKLNVPYRLDDIASIIGCHYIGNPAHQVTGINEIHIVESGDIVFVDHPKYYEKALNSAATTIIIDKETDCPEGKALIISENPFDDFNALTRHFAPKLGPKTDSVDQDLIYPNVYIGHNVHIGKNVRIYPGASILDGTRIHDNVIIGANSVIGHDAFYYKKTNGKYTAMHSCGNAIIEEGVEIGALCTIDRGVTGTTTIGKGTKLDNQVHVGHDTVIGQDCLIAAGVAIAGCVVIEDRVVIWGQVGIASSLKIGEGAIILAQSGVMKELEAGKTYFGTPCGEVKEKFRELVALRSLPDFMQGKK